MLPRANALYGVGCTSGIISDRLINQGWSIMQMPGEKLLEKMWDSLVDKGIGSLLRPWQARREGRAELINRRDETLLLAQAERDAEDIRAGKKRVQQDGNRILLLAHDADFVGGRAEPRLDMDSLIVAASEAKNAQNVLDEVNVARSIIHAESMLSNDADPVSEKQLDSDWLRSWREGAARVSSDELQSLWGKILAGEVKTPGSCSLRTLDFIRNISQDEAREISRICPYVSGGRCVFKYGVVEDREGFGAEYFMSLEELGLINTGGGLGLTITYSSLLPDSFVRMLFFGKRALLVEAGDAAKSLKLSMFRVTPLGTQVFSLNSGSYDESYVVSVGRACSAQGFEASVCDFEFVDDGGVNIFNKLNVKNVS